MIFIHLSCTGYFSNYLSMFAFHQDTARGKDAWKLKEPNKVFLIIT